MRNFWLKLLSILSAGMCAVFSGHLLLAQESRARQSGLAASAVVAGTNSMDVLDDQRKLMAGDRLSYRVVEERTEPRAVFVTDSGEVEVPLIGRIPAASKTCKALALAIKKELEKEYFFHATVILGLDAASGRSAGTIYLVGEIKTQGSMEIPSGANLTVTRAILKAGGFGDFANQRKVKVVRKSADLARSQTFIVDAVDVLKGNAEKDVLLEPDDVVIVPPRAVNF